MTVMEILINDTVVTLGDVLADHVMAAAGLHPASVLKKLLRGRGGRRLRLAAESCTAELFAGELKVYPCTHRYLNRDRQWQTAAEVVLDQGRVHKVLIRILEGRYAAPGFVDRFNELCNARLGAAKKSGGRQRWRNGKLRFTSFLEPDGMNADLVIEVIG
jgi:1-aminocyclopropane-1-carboxylate deaminase/D-cysteine desulfhydrase-like pyridoxal-dependent ACC family enzyme